MLSIAVPDIFYKSWFWWAILLGLAAAVYLVRKKKPAAFAKKIKVLTERKRTIRKITDIFLIAILLLGLSSLVTLLIPVVDETVLNPASDPKTRALYLRFSWLMFLMFAMCVSGWLGMLVGLLSVFQSNLTKAKRTILLVVCLLPVLLTILTVAIDPYEQSRSILRVGLFSSFACWLVNGPAVLKGKPWSHTIDRLLYRLFAARKERHSNDSSS